MDNTLNSKKANEKLLILYIIRKSNNNISYNQLSNLILEHNLIDYISFVEYFNELKDSKFIDKVSPSEIILSDFSIQTLDLMESTLDIIKKETIDKIFSTDGYDKNNQEFNSLPTDEGNFIVKLTIRGQLDENFSLSFTAKNKDDLKKISETWINKNKSLYHEILNLILDN